jgi:hypothetical protein
MAELLFDIYHQWWRGTNAERLAYTPLADDNALRWWTTDTKLLYVWDDGAWNLVGGGTGGMVDHANEWHTIDFVTQSEINASISTHVGLPDPHTQYQLESEKDALSGYAGLNGLGLVIKDPANATATPTASKIPIADGAGKLDGWIQSYLPSTAFNGLTKITVSATAPGTPSAGDLWVDTT